MCGPGRPGVSPVGQACRVHFLLLTQAAAGSGRHTHHLPGQRRLEGVVRHKFCQMASESNHGHLRIVGAIAGVGSGEVSKLLLGSELAGLVLTSNRVLL